MLPEFDAVLIGRNEGARLVRAIMAAQHQARRVIYVDSGSDDDSVAKAESLGAQVVRLDPVRPFTAGRARNEGFAALGRDRADLIQFIDGDCILDLAWPDVARDFLVANPQAGIVHGFNREEARSASVYNWLTDLEWQKDPGPASSGVGVFMCRSAVFDETGGFRNNMIAAEDDELFFRFRKAGWETWCLEAPMTLHDVALASFGKWFRRMVRAGHSFAELGTLHAGAALKPQIRAVFWAGLLPVCALSGALFWPPGVALVLALYALSLARQARIMHAISLDPVLAVKAAVLQMISKFPNLYGMLIFWWRRLRRSDARIIEYR